MGNYQKKLFSELDLKLFNAPPNDELEKLWVVIAKFNSFQGESQNGLRIWKKYLNKIYKKGTIQENFEKKYDESKQKCMDLISEQFEDRILEMYFLADRKNLASNRENLQ